MKTFRLLASLFAAATLTANVASGFSIASVSLSPGNYVAPWYPVQMTVNITTPSMPAFLYAPTQVTSNSSGIHIDIFPESGVMTAIGSLRETVQLGSFPIGTYQYEVVLHPGHEVNWGTRTNRGGFTVVGDKPTVRLNTKFLRVSEPCADCPAAATALIIERSDPTNDPVTVHLLIDGTATAGEDYRALPSDVEIPAGQRLANVTVEALDDELAEGPEVVRVRLWETSNYYVLVGAAEAMVVLYDNDPGAPAARLDFVTPTNGLHFGFAQTVTLSALGVYSNGEVYGPVEFYADGQLVAKSKEVATTRPPVAGLPSIHTAYWTNPPPGTHTLVARTQISFSQFVTSAPVNIIAEAPRGPVVSLDSSPPQNAQVPEFCPPNADCPSAGFVLHRTGPTNEALQVYLEYGGTATRDVDYHALSNMIVIPAGHDSIFVPLIPIDDTLVEGPETVVATFAAVPLPANGYVQDPDHRSASITIVDTSTNQPPFVQLNEPSDGQQFTPPVDIVLRAYAQDPEDSYSVTVEFFESTNSLGVGTFVPTRCASPYCPYFELVWSNVPPGEYSLRARATDQGGASSVSSPAHITVTDGNRALAVNIAATDPNATEQPATTAHAPDTATFTVWRSAGTNQSIVVYYAVSGTASNGVDYQKLPGQVTIPEGEFSADIVVTPIDDNLAEGLETVELTLIPPCPRCLFANPRCSVPQGTNCYPIGPHDSAVAYIYDDEPPPPPGHPIVSIDRTAAISEESSEPYRRLPMRGAFRISRTGPTTNDLPVFVIYSGTATPGDDYESLPFLVTIPAGSDSVSLPVSPVADQIPEPIETVLATVSNCPPPQFDIPCYDFVVDRAHSRATVFIRDDGITSESLPITHPTNGASFAFGEPVRIEVLAIDLEGFFRRVEFFADGQKIGESNIDSTRPPPGLTPQTFSFVWRDALPGRHALTARGTDSTNRTIISAAVQIDVTATNRLPIVTVAATDCLAVEPSASTESSTNRPNNAVFLVRRFGPTNEDLTISYLLEGSAENGVDYQRLTGSAVIAAGKLSTPVIIQPLFDGVDEGSETVILRVQEEADYQLGSRSQAGVLISDNPPVSTSGRIGYTLLADGCIQMAFPVSAAGTFRVEASSDLLHWETTFIALAEDGTLEFLETEMGKFPNRFYRVAPEAAPVSAE